MTTAGPYDHLRDQLTGMPPVPGLDAMGAAIHEPTAAQRLRVQPEQPEAVVYLPGPGGTMVPVLAEHQPPAEPAPRPAEPQATTDVWPMRLIAAGGSAAAVIGSIALAGPHLTEAGHAIEMAGIGVVAATIGAGALVSLIRGTGSSRQTPVNVSVSVTNANTSSSTAASHSAPRNR